MKILNRETSLLTLSALIILAFYSFNYSYVFAQDDPFASQQDDLKIGGDIFTDFNENIDTQEQMEDERYYRYGRFFTFQIGIGLNQFDGNRGQVYIKDPPTINLAINYFMDFKSSFGLGFDISKNHFVIGYPSRFDNGQTPNGVGLISVNHLTAYLNYRYYFDTSNMSTAITFANPYFTFRLDYWYQTLKYIDLVGANDAIGGGLGFAGGFGVEFPIKLKENYLGLELLLHTVNLPDKFTANWQQVDPATGSVVTGGIPDLSGNAYSIMVSYVINW